MDIRDLTRNEIIEIIKSKRLFSQKDLFHFFNNSKSVIVNELVKHKIRLLEIKREEIVKFILKNSSMTLKEISKIFNVTPVTLVRIKNKYNLARKNYIDYKNISNVKLKNLYKKYNYSISRIVKEKGGTPILWKKELIKRGMYKSELSEHNKNKGYKEKFLKEIEKRGEIFLKCKNETIAKMIGCSKKYIYNLKREYKKGKEIK